MSGKDASSWKKWLSFGLGSVVLVATCVAVRHYWGPGQADAQTRRPEVGQPSSNSTGVAPRQSVPLRSVDTSKLRIMAVVNGESITRDELAQACLDRFGEEVLEAMVNRSLIQSACAQYNIQVTNAEVEGEIEKMAKKFSLGREQLLQLLKEERGVDPDKYGTDVVWPTLALRKLAAAQIQVTQEEINRTIESELGEKVQVRMIALETAQMADQVRRVALSDPDNFGKLAKDNSVDRNSAAAWGLIPPVRRHVGDPAVEQAVFALQPDQISPVVEAGNQFLIFYCERRIAATAIPPQHRQDAEQRVVDHLRDKKLRKASTQIFQQLQTSTEVVNVLGDKEMSAKYPGIAAQVGNRQISLTEVSSECLKRHGKEVLQGEINRKLLMQSLTRSGETVSPEDIDAEVERAAIAFNYVENGKADVEGWLKHVTEDGASVEIYVRDVVWPTVALKKIVDSEVEVTEEDIQKGFEANFGPRVEALAIVCPSMREAQKVWRLARDSNNDRFFGQLAEQYSIEPVSKNNSGRIPPIQRHGGQPMVEEAAFSLAKGELSGIVTQGNSHIILKCIGHTKPVVANLEDVREELITDIREKKTRVKMAQHFDQVTAGAQIDNHLAGTSQTPRRQEVARGAISRRVPFTQQR